MALLSSNSNHEPSIFIIRNGSSSSFFASLESGAHLSLCEFCRFAFHIHPPSHFHICLHPIHIWAPAPADGQKQQMSRCPRFCCSHRFPPFSLFLLQNTFNVIDATKNWTKHWKQQILIWHKYCYSHPFRCVCQNKKKQRYQKSCLISHFPYLSRIIIAVIKVLIILKTMKTDKII